MKKFLMVALLCVLTGLQGIAGAAEVTSNFDFRVTLTGGCLITGNTAPVVNYSILSDSASSSFSVSFACTPNTNYTFIVGSGLHADSGTRRARGDSEYVKYRLYWDSGMTQEIGVNTSNSVSGTGNGNVETKTIYVNVNKTDNPNPALGTYTDTIRILVQY